MSNQVLPPVSEYADGAGGKPDMFDPIPQVDMQVKKSIEKTLSNSVQQEIAAQESDRQLSFAGDVPANQEAANF